MGEAASGLGNLAADATVMVAGHPKDWLVGHTYVSVDPELTILAPTEQSWGDRTCGFVDPFDNRW